MQYTPDQLVALVEEARGHIHEVMMGAIWTKERYDRCLAFMEKTADVECAQARRHTAVPDNLNGEASSLPTDITPAPAIHSPHRGRPSNLGHFCIGEPKSMAREIARLGYRIPDMSIDQEAAALRARQLPGSRDLIRLVVKELRALAKAG